jgi:hypothetical protein
MTHRTATLSMKVFGIYLFVLSTLLIVAPNVVLLPFGIPPTNDPWIRVLGVVAFGVGFYYWRAALTETLEFYRWTLFARPFVFVSFCVLALLRLAPAQIALFGLVDLGGAIWTFVGLRERPAPGPA